MAARKRIELLVLECKSSFTKMKVADVTKLVKVFVSL